MSDLTKKIKNWTIGIGLLAGITAGITSTMWSYYSSDKVRTKINETIVKRYDNSDKYLIFTDAGVFENTDTWSRFKFNSSDLQGELMKLKGKDVEITKYGWRCGFLSWYENIIKVKEVQPKK